MMESYRSLNEHLSSPKAAYLHVPFCHSRCPYCNFTVVANRLDLVDRYIDAVTRELTALGRPNPVNTIFIGGGTPTLLPREPMLRLFEVIRRWLPLADDGEWSIEANPQDVDRELCLLLRDQGINRISLGGQAFDSAKLKMLGRDHTGDQLASSIDIASQWFGEVSVDLIFGVPGEELQVWKSDLQAATSRGVSHLSTYGLTYEKGAQYWSQLQKGQIVAVAEETELEMYLYAIETLTQHGMNHYEISNFAKPGSECLHNQTYWKGDAWLGFGPGAAAYVGGTRSVNHRSTLKYLQRIETGQSPVAESQSLDWAMRTRERFIFGMRQLKGVDWSSLASSGEPTSLEAIAQQLPKHIALGFMEWHEGHIRLTPQGLPISDSLWLDYW
ncbi:MAG: radical SAM family heme chaperone HemW [Planctomycetota bacterium]|nr:radical SAM family heme chaperone HemW [Planctomycetota bacterium]